MIEPRHDATTTVADACADEAEVLALWVVRMVAAGYATGDVACWDAAHAGAEDVLGPETAGPFVARLTALVRAMRAERSAAWSFLPATCCRVTRPEADILRLLSAGRPDDAAAIARAGSALGGGPASPRLRDAARSAGRVVDEVARAAGPVSAPRRPHTRVH